MHTKCARNIKNPRTVTVLNGALGSGLVCRNVERTATAVTRSVNLRTRSAVCASVRHDGSVKTPRVEEDSAGAGSMGAESDGADSAWLRSPWM